MVLSADYEDYADTEVLGNLARRGHNKAAIPTCRDRPKYSISLAGLARQFNALMKRTLGNLETHFFSSLDQLLDPHLTNS